VREQIEAGIRVQGTDLHVSHAETAGDGLESGRYSAGVEWIALESGEDQIIGRVPSPYRLFARARALAIFIVKVFVAVAPALSVTWKVTEVDPTDVMGVPEMTPFELSANPAGS
jgi:hypothetical protein